MVLARANARVLTSGWPPALGPLCECKQLYTADSTVLRAVTSTDNF